MEHSWEAKLRAHKLELFTAKYYAACAAGGMISAGSVHFLVTPFDMLKVNMQADPLKYKSILSSFGIVYREQGMAGLWKGWGSKLYGYGAQGACKFGLYEYFKKYYTDIAGPTFAKSHKTSIYVAGSLSAQVIADVALCPFESVKVRVQTQPGFAKGLADGFPQLYRTEGLRGLYKGLLPLWGRNLPFAMLMFSTFEHSVDLIYNNVLHTRKSDCSKGVQLGVTCVAGYTSGVIGSLVSNPADNIITAIYKTNGGSYLQVVFDEPFLLFSGVLIYRKDLGAMMMGILSLPCMLNVVTNLVLGREAHLYHGTLAARNIGIIGLFTRSLPLRVMLVGPLVTAQWFCYDTIKVLLGLATSGGVEDLVASQSDGP